MNRLALAKRVRQHLAEAGQGQYSDPTITDQVSISARSLAGELGLIQTFATVSSLGAVVTLPAGTVNVIRATLYGRGTELHLAAASEVLAENPRAFETTTGGMANTLIVDEGLLGPGVARLYPGSTDGTQVTVYAFVDGGELLADTDVPWGGRYDAYHDVIAYHAAWHLVTRQGKAASGDATWLNRYRERLQALTDRGSANSLSDHSRISAPISRGHARRGHR